MSLLIRTPPYWVGGLIQVSLGKVTQLIKEPLLKYSHIEGEGLTWRMEDAAVMEDEETGSCSKARTDGQSKCALIACVFLCCL